MTRETRPGERGSAAAPGVLYVVSTPIGNLGDVTYRAIATLASVALIVAEDTRHSRALLDHYGVRTPCLPYHEHNAARETPALIDRLRAGDAVALISDAGTPLVSDPGSRLVSAAVVHGIPVVPIPGASALLAALVASALPTERFTFYGFLPRKGKERAETIAMLVRSPVTAIVYESPNRVAETLRDLAAAGAGERRVVLARELTKKFEEFLRGTVAEMAARVDGPVRGEIAIVLAGAPPAPIDDVALRARVAEWRAAGVSPRDMVERLVSGHGVARNLAYRLAHDTPA